MLISKRKPISAADEHLAMTNASLPNELVFEILTWLPGKQIGRCRCVCKEWRTMICSRSFMETYRSRQSGLLLYWSEDIRRRDKRVWKRLGYEIVRIRRLRFFHCPLRRHDEPLREFTPLRQLELVKSGGPQILSGVTQLIDGLLCVGENEGDTPSSNLRLTIHNICTGEKMRIPNPLSSHWSHWTYHLGYDPVSREYKLLRLIFGGDCSVEGAHIMTLRPPSSPLIWRVLDYNAAGIVDLRLCNGGLAEARTFRDDGMLCWFKGTSRCLCFDLHSERFRVVELPQDVQYDTGRVMKLCALSRFEDGLALWVAFYMEGFTVISCYVQEDDSGKKWKVLKEIKESGRFAFAEGKLPSSSAGGKMLLVDLDQPQRVYFYSFSHPQSEHTMREDVSFVGRLPKGAPAFNTLNQSCVWKNRLQSCMGRLSCFAEGNNLYLPLRHIFGGASAIV